MVLRPSYIGPGRRPIEEAELDRLLEAAHPEDRCLFLLGADSGLRRREIWGCEVSHVQNGIVAVPAAYAKYRTMRRTVATSRLEECVGVAVRAGRTPRLCPYTYGTLHWVLRDALNRARLPLDLCWHSLRHRFAMRAILAGVPLHELQDFMGHRWITTTLVYLHLSDDRFQRGRDAMERAAGGKYGRGWLRVVHGGPDSWPESPDPAGDCPS